MLIQDLNYVETFNDLDIEGAAVTAFGNAGVTTSGTSFGTGTVIGQVTSGNISGSLDTTTAIGTGSFASLGGGFVNSNFAAFAF